MTSVAPGGRDAELLRALSDRIEQHDPGAFNNLGVLYFSKGLLVDAVEAFLRALALDPRMRTAARNLEIAAAVPGACDAHLARLDARLVAEPSDTAARHQRARLLRLIGRHADATAALDALIADDPDDASMLFERGLIEQRAGDLRRAQKWLERAVNAAPVDPIPRLHLAEVLYHRGQNEQSLDALDALLLTAPSMAEAHLLRGFVLGDMGHHEAGLAAARQAAQINPALGTLQADLSLDAVVGSPSPTGAPGMLGVVAAGALARYGLGLAFRQRGYFDEARREFERARDNGEDSRLVRHALAELDLLAGRSADARDAYATLLAEEPEQPRHWNEHGVALHQSGELEGAAESYRRALRSDPRYAIAYNNLGVALADLGDAGAAREAFSRAVELDAGLVCARLNMARWHARQRDALSALALLREVVAFHPSNADAWHEMGRVLQLLHRHEDARDAFARAIEHRADHAEARYALAEVLGSLGDGDGALRETQRALGLAPLRATSRLTVAIELQQECPDAVSGIDLLALGGGAPLAGLVVSHEEVADLLPDLGAGATTESGVGAAPATDDATADCDQADAFSGEGLHGEALERYARVRVARDGAPDALWRRAVLGEARSRCLLGDGSSALPLLRVLGRETPRDPEVLALFARCAADGVARGDVAADVARTAMLRLLRVEAPSAALMHFVGDAAVKLNDEALALAFFRRALAIDPSRPTPRVSIATLLRRRGDLLAARLELVAALAVVPGRREAVLELARVHRDASRPAETVALLVRHLSAHTTDIEALVLLVEALVVLERGDDARVVIARILRHEPEERGARWFEGVLFARQGRMREAAARWRTVADSDAPDEFTERARRSLVGIGDETEAHATPPLLMRTAS